MRHRSEQDNTEKVGYAIVLGEVRFMMTHLLDTSWDVQYLKIKLSACSYLAGPYA